MDLIHGANQFHSRHIVAIMRHEAPSFRPLSSPCQYVLRGQKASRLERKTLPEVRTCVCWARDGKGDSVKIYIPKKRWVYRKCFWEKTKIEMFSKQNPSECAGFKGYSSRAFLGRKKIWLLPKDRPANFHKFLKDSKKGFWKEQIINSRKKNVNPAFLQHFRNLPGAQQQEQDHQQELQCHADAPSCTSCTMRQQRSCQVRSWASSCISVHNAPTAILASRCKCVGAAVAGQVRPLQV